MSTYGSGLYESLMWETGAVKVVGFTTAGRKGSTTIKVEMTVSKPNALGDLIRDLAELRDAPAVRKGEGNADA